MSPTDLVIAAALGVPPLRYEVLNALREGPLSASELMAATGLSRGSVLSHLRRLCGGGIVFADRRRVPHSFRPVTYYTLDVEALADGLDAILAGC